MRSMRTPGANVLKTSWSTPEKSRRGQASLRAAESVAGDGGGKTVRLASHGGASRVTAPVVELQRTVTMPAWMAASISGASSGTGVLRSSSKAPPDCAAMARRYGPEGVSRVTVSVSGESGGCQVHGPAGGPVIPSQPEDEAMASGRCAPISERGSFCRIVQASAAMPSSPEALRTTTVNAVSASTSGAWASVSVRITSPRACSAMGSSVVTTGWVGPCHAASWSSRETCVSAGARSMRRARSRTRVSPVAGPVSSHPSGRERRISPRRPLGCGGRGFAIVQRNLQEGEAQFGFGADGVARGRRQFHRQGGGDGEMRGEGARGRGHLRGERCRGGLQPRERIVGKLRLQRDHGNAARVERRTAIERRSGIGERLRQRGGIGGGQVAIHGMHHVVQRVTHGGGGHGIAQGVGDTCSIAGGEVGKEGEGRAHVRRGERDERAHAILVRGGVGACGEAGGRVRHQRDGAAGLQDGQALGDVVDLIGDACDIAAVVVGKFRGVVVGDGGYVVQGDGGGVDAGRAQVEVGVGIDGAGERRRGEQRVPGVAVEEIRAEQQHEARMGSVHERIDLREQLRDGAGIAGQIGMRVGDGLAAAPAEDFGRLRIHRHDAIAGGEMKRKRREVGGDIVERHVAERRGERRVQHGEQA